MCYFTYCKNNRHNHSPTWEFVTTFKKSSSHLRPPSTHHHHHLHRQQCFSTSFCFLVSERGKQAAVLSDALFPPRKVWSVCVCLQRRRFTPSTALGGTGPYCHQNDCCLVMKDPNTRSAASPKPLWRPGGSGRAWGWTSACCSHGSLTSFSMRRRRRGGRWPGEADLWMGGMVGASNVKLHWRKTGESLFLIQW